MSENKIKPPNIPIETNKRMQEFFMKTSIPRILEEEQRRKEVESQKNANKEK